MLKKATKTKTCPSKHPVTEGVKRYPDGREVCMTPAAWNRRKDEVYRRDGGICQVSALIGKLPHRIQMFESWTADHKTKRGMGGSTRDDRAENLRLTCEWCHAIAHDTNIHGENDD